MRSGKRHNKISKASDQWQRHYGLNALIVRACCAYSMTQWDINRSVQDQTCWQSKVLADQFFAKSRVTAGVAVSPQGWDWTAGDHHIRWLIYFRENSYKEEMCCVIFSVLNSHAVFAGGFREALLQHWISTQMHLHSTLDVHTTYANGFLSTLWIISQLFWLS